MTSHFNISDVRLNCQKMLRNSRKYQTETSYSFDAKKKSLKNWIDINKKEFLLKPKAHVRSYSLQQKTCSPIKRIQIGFPPEKKKKQSSMVEGTRCNSAETSSSGNSHSRRQLLFSPRKEGERRNQTNRAMLFQIISYRSSAKQKNEIKGLKQSRFEHLFKRPNLEEDSLAIRGMGIL